jgi:RNA polymerase sigma-70 factor (ECF subfamily)
VLDTLSREEKLDWLAEAIAELPDRCRDVFLLHKIEGLSWKEVATQLNISVRTVEHHSQKGMHQVEAYLRTKGQDLP